MKFTASLDMLGDGDTLSEVFQFNLEQRGCQPYSSPYSSLQYSGQTSFAV